MSALTTAVRPIKGVLRPPVRLIGPEGVVWMLVLAVPGLAVFRIVESYTPFLLLGGITATAALGWRFRRGRVIHGVAVLGLISLLPLLPAVLHAPLATLAALDLVLLGLLPDRGVLSAGALGWGLALVLQAGWGVRLAASPDLAPSILMAVPGGVSGLALAHGLALTALAVLALTGSGAIQRGLFWAGVTTVVLALGPFHALAGPSSGLVSWPAAWAVSLPASWAALAGILALLVAAVEEAHQLAYQDGLTRLPGRRALDERLQRLTGRYTVAMVDVDHFKKFNDRHGHDVGDQILRMVAARIAQTPGARAYRYGGEEFTLVFRGKSVDEARESLEEVRQRVGDRPFVIRGADRPARKPKRRLFLWRERQELSVTVSLGAAERTGWRQSPAEVLKEADAALYRAKKAGRNRIVA